MRLRMHVAGGIEELRNQMTDEKQCYYALFRTTGKRSAAIQSSNSQLLSLLFLSLCSNRITWRAARIYDRQHAAICVALHSPRCTKHRQHAYVARCTVRCAEVIDKSTTVKFCLVKMIGGGVPTMFKAKISTHKGFVDRLFAPIHTEFLHDSIKDFTPVRFERFACCQAVLGAQRLLESRWSFVELSACLSNSL